MIATSLNDPIYSLLKQFGTYATPVERGVLISYIVENRLPRGHYIAKPSLASSGMAAISTRGEIRTVISDSLFYLIDWLKTDGLSDGSEFTEEYCPYCTNEVLIPSDGAGECPECGNRILPCSRCEAEDCSECIFDENKSCGKPSTAKVVA